jgi:hypothetical protein
VIARLVLAVVIAVVVGLVCLLLGGILAGLGVPIAKTVGDFLEHWGWVLGVLAGLWYFFAGGFAFPSVRP